MQQFESFRNKLKAGIESTINADLDIVFSDGSTFPSQTILPILKDTVTQQYSYGSFWLAVISKLQGLTTIPYIQASKRYQIPTYFSLSEIGNVLQYVQGDGLETDYFLSLQDAIALGASGRDLGDRSLKTIKKQKISALTMNEYAQLELTIAPNNSFTLSNTPFHVNDYMSTMHELYAELLTDFSAPAGTAPAAESQGIKRKSIADPTATANNHATSKPIAPEVPIIIVPAGTSTSFTFTNLGDLLQDGVYHKPSADETTFKVKPDLSKIVNLPYEKQLYYEKTASLMRPSVVRPGTSAKFQICCDPSLLSLKDWERVVAIIVSGKAYQLDSFPQQFKLPNGQTNIAQLFSTYTGVYLYFENEVIPSTIAQWNVSKHKFSSSKRHQDQVVITDVWRRIVEHCQRRQRVNPNLYF